MEDGLHHQAAQGKASSRHYSSEHLWQSGTEDDIGPDLGLAALADKNTADVAHRNLYRTDEQVDNYHHEDCHHEG